jgi:hypothetical protein
MLPAIAPLTVAIVANLGFAVQGLAAGLALLVRIVLHWHRTVRAVLLVAVATLALELAPGLGRLPGLALVIATFAGVLTVLARFEGLISEMPTRDGRFDAELRRICAAATENMRKARTVADMESANADALARLSALGPPDSDWARVRDLAVAFYASRLRILRDRAQVGGSAHATVAEQWRSLWLAWDAALLLRRRPLFSRRLPH